MQGTSPVNLLRLWVYMSAHSSLSLSLLETLIQRARHKGAEAADAILIDSTSTSVSYRLGKVESLERAEVADIGLRVFIGKRQAIVSSTDRRESTLDELVERAVAMAKIAPEDPYCGLADSSEIAHQWSTLDIADTYEPSTEKLIMLACEAEEAGRSVKGVTNSEGTEAGYSVSSYCFAASNGFVGNYQRTGCSLSATMLAGDGTGMERDYDYASRVMFRDLPEASTIGRRAGERTVKRLGARKMPTGRLPVVFDPRVAGSLVGQLAGAISGVSVARGTSFLKDKLGQFIFPEDINIIDDPFRAQGLRSRPFDAEGLLPVQRKVIERGVLTTWLLDLRSARQLKLKSTGHASRAAGGSPSPSASNLYVEAGSRTPADLMRDIKQGFYVTDLMGMGVNGVTGDYSQAAAGFWIENGRIVFPVNEMTIASDLKDMYRHFTVANDLEFHRGIDCPTTRVEGMTVAGT